MRSLRKICGGNTSVRNAATSIVNLNDTLVNVVLGVFGEKDTILIPILVKLPSSGVHECHFVRNESGWKTRRMD